MSEDEILAYLHGPHHLARPPSPGAEDSGDYIDVLQTRYFYRAVPPQEPAAIYEYILERVEQGRVRVKYQRLPIEVLNRGQLVFFNHIVSEECNRESLLLVFRLHDHSREFVCRPCCDGSLEIVQDRDPRTGPGAVPRHCTATFADPAHLLNSDLACSVYALFYDYIRVPSGRERLVGVAAVPCAAQFMPKRMDGETLREWLCTWSQRKLASARRNGRIVLREAAGASCSISHVTNVATPKCLLRSPAALSSAAP